MAITHELQGQSVIAIDDENCRIFLDIRGIQILQEVWSDQQW